MHSNVKMSAMTLQRHHIKTSGPSCKPLSTHILWSFPHPWPSAMATALSVLWLHRHVRTLQHMCTANLHRHYATDQMPACPPHSCGCMKIVATMRTAWSKRQNTKQGSVLEGAVWRATARKHTNLQWNMVAGVDDAVRVQQRVRQRSCWHFFFFFFLKGLSTVLRLSPT